MWPHANLFTLLLASLSGSEGKEPKLTPTQVDLGSTYHFHPCVSLWTLGDKIGPCWSWPSHSLAVTPEKAGQVWSRHILCFRNSCFWSQGDFVREGKLWLVSSSSSILVTPLKSLAEDEFCAPGGLTNPSLRFPFRAPAALNLPTTLRECQCLILNFHLDSSVSRQRSLKRFKLGTRPWDVCSEHFTASG